MKKYDICVIGGCGHVGLPLAIAFADAGKNVGIYDINSKSVDFVNSGRMPFDEPGAEPLLKKNIGNRLIASTDPSTITQAKFVVIIIGTPVDEHLNPKMDLMERVSEEVHPYITDDQIIILRSTVYPGTSERFRQLLQRLGKNTPVCYCPERIAEGKAMEELGSLPQIVSGFDNESVEAVKELFLNIASEIIVTLPKEAELAKLFTNSWRYISFAVANQFYMMAEDQGVDFNNIYNAMTHNYPRTKHFPKPGFAAGPCLFKDTMQLSAFNNNSFFIGHSAMLINEGLPKFMVEQAKKRFDLKKMKVGILGMAFKGESDDPRESLSYKLWKIVKTEADQVYAADDNIKDPRFLSEKEFMETVDLVIIGAPHNRYKTFSFGNMEVLDIWNIINK
ncbi:MAG: nucleotide sugar dehydrogenase [Bacteroidetes bacterium]|nr:nucleotide sugar dehydrogenase [Bacteroidota bacterium]